MGVLRDQMIRELHLRRYAPATQKAYLEAIVGLTKHFRIAPDQLSARQVQDYLLYLMLERKLHWNTVNAICSGLTFFYTQTVNRPDVALAMPLRRTPRQLPEILSGDELKALFAAVDQPQHRALLMTTYGGGLRVSEVIKLRPRDIDSQRMMIRVVAGKRAKDRYTLLSVRLLEELRAYWRIYRPRTWLFPARRRRSTSTTTRRAKSSTRPRPRPAFARPAASICCAIASPPTCSRPASICAPSKS